MKNKQMIQGCLDSGAIYIRIQGRVLRLGSNDGHRICRPAWTSTDQTGQFDSHKHRHGRDLEYNFYIRTEGFYQRQKPQKCRCNSAPCKCNTSIHKKNATHRCSKRGGA